MTRLVPRRLYHWFLFRQLPGIKTWGTGDHTALQALQADENRSV